MSAAFEFEFPLLEAYSRGEVTRREIEARTGSALGFGLLLSQLHAHGLSLPRFPSDPSSPAFDLIRRLAEQLPRGG
jgi:hypothetical protein